MQTNSEGSTRLNRNWNARASGHRASRRRLIVALRMAHRVLGMDRNRLGFGSLGLGSNALAGYFSGALFIAAIGALGAVALPGSALALDAVCVDPATGAPVGTTSGSGDEVACGQGAVASGPEAIAVGAGALAPLTDNIAIGHGATVVAPASPTSLNNGIGGMAIGAGASVTAGSGSYPTLAIGYHAIGSGISATALGGYASATATDATAIGVNSNAYGDQATALGHAASAAAQATALGRGSVASGGSSTAVGLYATASGGSSVALGRDAQASGGLSIATGRSSRAYGGGSIAQGYGAIAGVSGSTAINYDVAQGYGAKATGGNAIAIGHGALASGASSISIGTGNNVSGNNSGAIGDPTTITGQGSYSVGNDNNIAGDNAGAFGNNNILSSANGSRIIGNGNDVDVSDAFILGNNADVTVAGGVALGSGSVASTASGVAGYVPSGADATAINATQSTLAAISVGDAANGVYRQINGVAAGTADSDAVNVAQLKALDGTISDLDGLAVKYDSSTKDAVTLEGTTGTKITNLKDGAITSLSSDAINGSQLWETSNSFATYLGGGASINALGVLTGPTYLVNNISNGGVVSTGTYYNVGDALGALSTSVLNLNTQIGAISGTLQDALLWDPAENAYSADHGANGTPNKITNVADGNVNPTSTDAVNGSQLNDTNEALAELDNSAVKYDLNPDGTKKNSVTLIGGDPNAPVVISNVAAGVADTDAANVGQLKDGLQTTLNQSTAYTDAVAITTLNSANTYTDTVARTTLASANAYTDSRFNELNSAIGDAQDSAHQAAAVGLAAASLRYDDRPGKFSIAAGGGVWEGQGAGAFGAGYTSDNQKVRANLSAATTGGDWGVGGGLSFTLN